MGGGPGGDHLKPFLSTKGHEGPGQSHLNSDAKIGHEGRPQGGEGTHKGCPYQLSSSRRFGPGKGTHKGSPLPIRILRLRTMICPQGVPLPAFLRLGKGTHKGCPYRLVNLSRVLPWGGHPQGVPLPIGLLSAHAGGEGTHKGRPYPIVFSRRAHPGGKGTHKGCPYGWLMRARAHRGGGHPQGVPLRLVNEGARTPGGRAPTRGAPTGFRQPHEVFSNLMQLPWAGGGRS